MERSRKPWWWLGLLCALGSPEAANAQATGQNRIAIEETGPNLYQLMEKSASPLIDPDACGLPTSGFRLTRTDAPESPVAGHPAATLSSL
jgi:hypothetical protein